MIETMDGLHTQCFLFASCDANEACAECISGPEEPKFYDCARRGPARKSTKPLIHSTKESYTCATEIKNVVDVYYFSEDDPRSCQHQCSAVNECNFWTSLVVSDGDQERGGRLLLLRGRSPQLRGSSSEK